MCLFIKRGNSYEKDDRTDFSGRADDECNTCVGGGNRIRKTYNIDGNNFFKLRDLGTALDFQIGWDNASQTISITTEPSTVIKPTEKEEKPN